ncbi:CPBP family glutamic-type intramembrane protease [Polymorphospora sp. NPDC050346]|uniref:CPBP family glutamic-type intramembrane protease n=1 Tax=Polymorphospora sp. NPDC050346 TaxID=3155780 RepID=UPI0034034426
MRTKVLTAAGLLLLAAVPVVLLLSGRTDLRTSADEEAGPIPLAAVVVPVLAAMLLTRLVPPRLPGLPPIDPDQRAVYRRQAVGLTLIALVFPVVAVVVFALPDGGLFYGPVKVLLLIGVSWLVLRRWPAPSPAAAHRALLPRRWYLFGAVPAVLAWGYLLYYSPLSGDRDMSGYEAYDPAVLAGAAVFTFLTASVTEEIFYRVFLQTRLEVLLGRWPAIVATALLFAAMHVHRFGDGPFGENLAVILAWNGGFGLLTGYLWARYRNVWVLIVVHGAVNSMGLLPLLFG